MNNADQNVHSSDALAQSLKGIKVVALEQAISMPYCTFMLAEMGAEVIKIERKGSGDVVRGWDSAVGGMSTGFVWVNAGKKSVALDLRNDGAKAALRALIATADVFVENLGPGSVARLGLGRETFSEHPGLIYVSLSGYGQNGPARDRKAYDLTMQAETGILLTNGSPDNPAKVGLPITDLIAGSNAAIGILSALQQRSHTGQGCYLDIAMFDSALPWLGYYPHHAWHSGTEPPRSGMHHQYIVPYGPYMASDGRQVCLAIGDDKTWGVFCKKVIERPDWIGHPIFGTIATRRQHRDQVEPEVAAILASKPSYEWFKRLDEASIGYGNVNKIADVIEHPQAKARQMFVQATSNIGEVPLVRHPLGPINKKRHLPALSEHTNSVLVELGFQINESGSVERIAL